MEKFKTSKIITIGIAAILAAALMTSCGGGDTKASESTDSTPMASYTMPPVTSPIAQVPPSETPAANNTIPTNSVTVAWTEEDIEPKQMKVIVKQDELSVRTGPEGGDASPYAVVAKLKKDAIVTVNKKVKDGTWYRLADSGYYVSAEFLEEVSNVPPIVEPEEDDPVNTSATPAP